MLLCYVDESGSTGSRLDDADQPVHYVLAVLVREDRVRQMNDRLEEIAADAPTAKALLEYHGNELFGGSGEWTGVPPRQRIREYDKALAVLAEVGATVVHASINKARLDAKGYSEPNPHLFALQFLTEKIERWVRYQDHPLAQSVLLVADENHEQEQFSMDLIKEMQASGGPVGSQGLSLDHFLESVYFTSSHRSRGVQVADLAAFLLNRRDRNARRGVDDSSSRAVAKLWSDRVDPQVKTWRATWP